MRRMEELNTCMWDTFTYPNRFQIKFIAAFTKQAAQIVLEIRSDFTAIKRHSADGTTRKDPSPAQGASKGPKQIRIFFYVTTSDSWNIQS